MSKKVRWLIIVTGMLAVFLTLAIGIPTVMADNSTQPAMAGNSTLQKMPPSAMVKDNNILTQVAAILNISTDNLTQAFKQAAQSSNGTGATDDAFYAKVAGILGIDKATLEAAVQKAASAMLDNNVASMLDQAVAKGTITKDEEAQIETWFSQRPSAIGKLFNIDRLHSLMGWGQQIMEKTQNSEHGKSSEKTPKMTPLPKTSANMTSLRMR